MTSIILAVLLDAAAGDPYWFPHPVRLIGKYISSFEDLVRKFFRTPAALKASGILLTISLYHWRMG